VNDEKTTEIEIPAPLTNNIVRVNFIERRKSPRGPASNTAPAAKSEQRIVVNTADFEWHTPLWVRIGALVAILALSLFVL
jgi:hypothetical protein